MSRETKQRNYKLPVGMVVALRKLCKREAMNESAFVRQAIAAKMEDYGIVVDAELQHGGTRATK